METFEQTWKSLGSWVNGVILRRSKPELVVICFLLVALIGFVEFQENLSVSLTALFAIPLSVVAWYVGRSSAIWLSIFGTMVWVAGYNLAHRHLGFPAAFSAMSLRIFFFTFVSTLVARLSHLQHNLEAVAETRARALAREVAERERLEREMLEISEREQRRIGQDLHDGLCQLLTGAALAGHAHARSLSAQGLVADAQKTQKIVSLNEEAIALARSIAKGLDPIEMQSDSLMQALEEFAGTTSDLFGIKCRFGCHVPVHIHSPSTAVHLYRIAQEAVGNAVKHGKATAIDIMLEETEVGVQLSITDNGKGLPDPVPRNDGMGIRTMNIRAKLSGGQFSINRLQHGGAGVNCVVPEAVNG